MPRSAVSRKTPNSPTADARQRILAAAKEEFARYGIAGARVDRLAKQARTSKERVYAYFSSKEALYHHITEHETAALIEATRMDPTDLPGYAGILFDHFTAHPDHYRLITWGRLELADGEADSDTADPMLTTITGKVEQLRDAQRAGLLDPAWDPVDVLALINQIATTWAGQPEIGAAAAQLATDTSVGARRAALVTAVERLFPRPH
ncbi:TetR family transcriptional regulator [Streptomyces sp. WI04-05B]|uniref:TetR family transcriptional regulator n=1 Tax=Streptomyces TaxID=1883 RepID=UPI0029BCE402|nr:MULTISPECIES: TetR family transcriptional regulator [unclassified Streptomyces]MDX2542243.1 TetR family transcriptional regulator [Streptomyces sp. WI04-05B]MDX2584075.1 TetR family transcriptional regulator [Streptomyces sp. WI04-05A]MDX3750212.1 TetR family transcriptional regulator [Streptomyces sp. AK08-02]